MKLDDKYDELLQKKAAPSGAASTFLSLFCSSFLYFHKFFFEDVCAIYNCIFEGLGILLDYDRVARDLWSVLC